MAKATPWGSAKTAKRPMPRAGIPERPRVWGVDLLALFQKFASRLEQYYVVSYEFAPVVGKAPKPAEPPAAAAQPPATTAAQPPATPEVQGSNWWLWLLLLIVLVLIAYFVLRKSSRK
jgi:hypothetical protein